MSGILLSQTEQANNTALWQTAVKTKGTNSNAPVASKLVCKNYTTVLQ